MRRLLAFLLLTLLLAAPVRAAEAGETDLLFREARLELGLDSLEAALADELPGVEIGPRLDPDRESRRLLEEGRRQLPGVVRQAVRSAVVLLAVVLLCTLAETLTETAGERVGPDTAALAGSLAITAAAVADVHALVGLGRAALGRMLLFSKTLLPAMAAAGAASGSPSRASAQQLAAMLFSDVLLTVIDRVLLPLVYLYILVLSACAALGNEGLSQVGNVLKWVVTSCLTLILLSFVTYLTVSGVIAGNADAIALKAARMTISGLVPVVGGILADASESVLVGAGVLRNAIGVFGMLGVLAICLTPFLQLGVHYLVYKLTAALAATVSEGRLSRLIDGIGRAFGLVLGMTGAGALLLLVALMSAIKLAAGGM